MTKTTKEEVRMALETAGDFLVQGEGSYPNEADSRIRAILGALEEHAEALAKLVNEGGEK